MRISEHFSIPYLGMKNGFHKYTFKADSAFFSEFDHAPISDALFDIVLNVDKRPGISDVEIDIKGKYAATCDRCLADVKIPVEATYHMLIKVTHEAMQDDVEVIYVKEDQSHIYFGQVVYELICLSLPWVNVFDCQKEFPLVCNQEILQKLEQTEKSTSASTGKLWLDLKGIEWEEE